MDYERFTRPFRKGWTTIITKRLLTLISGVAILLLSGCCDSEVEWLPDSSRFIDIMEDGTLAHYDMARQAWQVITKIHANGEGTRTVSSTGKQIAVCRQITSGTNESTATQQRNSTR